jgi:hypothetical protein
MPYSHLEFATTRDVWFSQSTKRRTLFLKIVPDLRRKIHLEPIFVDGSIEIAIQKV